MPLCLEYIPLSTYLSGYPVSKYIHRYQHTLYGEKTENDTRLRDMRRKERKEGKRRRESSPSSPSRLLLFFDHLAPL